MLRLRFLLCEGRYASAPVPRHDIMLTGLTGDGTDSMQTPEPDKNEPGSSERPPARSDESARQSDGDVWTVRRILTWTTEYLSQRGVESARLEAELLLAHCCRCARIRLYAAIDRPLTDAERACMRDVVRRRAAREPIAYIIGMREFYSREFRVGPAVLVPRPETETLVDKALDRIPRDRQVTVLDLGTGSGCVGITIALQRPAAEVTASDISPAALETARENTRRHKAEDRLTLIEGDLFDGVEPGMQFDMIVSNPPYVRQDELKGLQPEVRDFEPHSALVSGEDGLELIRRLIASAPDFLKDPGSLLIECDPLQTDAVRQLMQQRGFQEVRVHNDSNKQPRVVSGDWSLS